MTHTQKNIIIAIVVVVAILVSWYAIYSYGKGVLTGEMTSSQQIQDSIQGQFKICNSDKILAYRGYVGQGPSKGQIIISFSCK